MVTVPVLGFPRSWVPMLGPERGAGCASPGVPKCHRVDFSLFPLEMNTLFWFHHTSAPEKLHSQDVHGPALSSSRLGCPAPGGPDRCLEHTGKVGPTCLSSEQKQHTQAVTNPLWASEQNLEVCGAQSETFFFTPYKINIKVNS